MESVNWRVEEYFVSTLDERMLSFAGATWKYATSVQTWNHHNRSALSSPGVVFFKFFWL